MKLINQISVFLENKPGMMAKVTQLFAQNGVDMRALSLAETSDFGIVRVIVDDVYKASMLLKDEGYIFSVNAVLGVVIPDEPGGLNRVLHVLDAAGMNIEYVYAFLAGQSNHAYMILRVQDNAIATAALNAENITCIGEEELQSL